MHDHKLKKEKEIAYIQKEQKRLINKFLGLLDESDDRFNFELGNARENTVIQATYIKNGQHNFVTIYSFDPLEKQKAKEKLICDAMAGKVDIDDFSDLKFLDWDGK